MEKLFIFSWFGFMINPLKTLKNSFKSSFVSSPTKSIPYWAKSFEISSNISWTMSKLFFMTLSDFDKILSILDKEIVVSTNLEATNNFAFVLLFSLNYYANI